MKRKIFNAIKQTLCRHRYEFVECDRDNIRQPYFLYVCKKCKEAKIIFTWNIKYEIEHVDPKKYYEYPVEELWIPYLTTDLGDQKLSGKDVAFVVSKYYDKYGILLTAYGNKKYGPKIDRNNLEMKSHDEIIDSIKRGDGLPLFILSPNELRENSGLTKLL